MTNGASPERGSARDAPLTCSSMVLSVSQPVVTSLTFFGKRVPVIVSAFPEGSTFTTEVAALMFGVAKRTIWNEISEKRARMSPATYRRGRRLLTQHDIEVLRTIFTVTVKL